MVGWDLKHNRFMPKGDNIDVKNLGIPDEDGLVEVSLFRDDHSHSCCA
jgi:hypothetical protein